jgi:hypothetical protein
MVALKRINVTCKSIDFLVVTNFPLVHKSLMMNDRGIQYIRSNYTASVICNMGDSCLLLSNVTVYIYSIYIQYIYIYNPNDGSAEIVTFWSLIMCITTHITKERKRSTKGRLVASLSLRQTTCGLWWTKRQ